MQAKTIQKDSFYQAFVGNFVDFISAKFIGSQRSELSSRSARSTSSSIGSSDFLYAITHELKTPLNAILGFADILQEDLLSKKSKGECLDFVAEIKRAGDDMKELINDLLDVGQVSSGNFSVDLTRKIDVSDVIRRVVRMNSDYSLRRRVSLKIEICDDLMSIKLDAKRMKQILTNLISNSIKYSPKNSEVKISARNFIKDGRNFLEIIVADQGFGMTKAQVETAFQKYRTIENANSKSVDSFGLGLPIVKQLVELQNGEIEIKSELGSGTVVRLIF